MTPEMRFECLLVSKDPAVLGALVDLDAVRSTDLLQHLGLSQPRQKPTVVAISATELAVPGVGLMVRKPVTLESGIRSLKAAYTRTLQDFRKHIRFALMAPVLATDENSRHVSLTVTNIGEGGVASLRKRSWQSGALCASA